MNYIQLINRFWKLNQVYTFTAQEGTLYFKLLDICNSYYWKSFKILDPILCGEIRMKEARMVDARKKLVETGLIHYSGGIAKRQPTTYTILCGDEANLALQAAIKYDIQCNSQCNSQSNSQSNSQNNSHYSLTMDYGNEPIRDLSRLYDGDMKSCRTTISHRVQQFKFFPRCQRTESVGRRA